jgi:DNA-binding beta-propeller fold protein YncE
LGAAKLWGRKENATLRGYALAALVLLLPISVFAQAIIGTIAGSNEAIVFPSPDVALPVPVRVPISGLPPGALPNSVAFFGSDGALVSDAHFHKVYVVRMSTLAVVATIDTYPPFNGTSPTYDGSGTLAISPDSRFALAQSGSPATLAVIAAPFSGSSTITTVPLPGVIAGNQTQAIVFDQAGRAFVYLDSGVASNISVLDPPYSSVAFSIPVSSFPANAIAITPDGGNLLVTTFGSGTVRVFAAPFSVSSVPASLSIPGLLSLDGIMATPDGSKVLVVASNVARLFAISAPFGSSSAVDEIALAPGFGGFEDIGVSADGQLAILAGGGAGTPDTAFVRGPFTTSGATVFDVIIPGGRGNGSVRFLPTAGFSSVAVPVLAVRAIVLLAGALALIGVYILRH